MKIIALVDGSAYSHSVCHHTAWAASRLSGTAALYHVIGRRGGDGRNLSGSIRLGARTALLEELATLEGQRAKLAIAHGRAILDDAKEIVLGDGVTVVETSMRQGDLLEVLEEVEGNADMLVVGKRGEAADFAKLHLGSNLERILRASHLPVLIANRAFKAPQKLLVAFDGGPSSKRAVAFLGQSALFADLDITLAAVGTASQTLRADLETGRQTLNAAGRRADIRILPGQPETILGDLVASEGFDLLVMGAYGHSRIRSMIIGSTTTQMIRTCKVPIFVMR